ncbi:MAG: glycogen debranching protein GlgX [Spirochaetales bacterium]|nr:glycogen debranching protein GlgX [Spirochaetales bacterium]
MREPNLVTRHGNPRPFGAEPVIGGVNFAVFSRHATCMRLCLFERADDAEPYFDHRLDPVQNKTGDIWHIHVDGIGPGTLYAWRVDGPFIPDRGFRFNPNKLLLDPYAKALSGNFEWKLSRAVGYNPEDPARDLSFSIDDDAALVPKCVVVDDDAFDWEGDRPLNLPLRHCIIYETHVRGLSAHASAHTSHPGTYLGVVSAIPYLKELGITSLELLPVQEFDHHENQRHDSRTGKRLYQYWGYSTLAFFAPKGRYASSGCSGQQVAEFKTMVKELHKAGIEVILDVVFNHTGEGNELGPTISFRGFDNPIWYMLDDDPRYYKNYSGCGNTLNCNHPVVRNFILDCLHYWVVDMHVDGFRFDLGSILGRDQKGRMLENPPVIEQIAEDPILRQTKIIAEAWDAGGAYQVGSFPGGRWAEWNDRYRDDIRRFWRGDERMAAALATRLSGSSDLYLRDGRKPFHSINYITSHDGFTLYDLVSYNGKHNERNGEHGRDGHDSNFSYNHGHEGPTKDDRILKLRERKQKNYLATLLLSIGTPMMLGGDEFGRTQRGNNNAYCQDNELSWFDWSLRVANTGLLRFVREVIAIRHKHPAFRRPDFFTGKDANFNAVPDIAWYAPDGTEPSWEDMPSAIAVRMDGSRADIMAEHDDNNFFIMFNATPEPLDFVVPRPQAGWEWHRAIDTALDSPDDIAPHGAEPLVPRKGGYHVMPWSMALLLSRTRET